MKNRLMEQEFVLFDLEVSNKEEAIRALIDAMDCDGRIGAISGYYDDVLKREAQASTAVGMMVATPHAKSKHVNVPSLGFARFKRAIQWDESEEVKMIFLIAVPEAEDGNQHLEIISSLFRKMVYDDFRDALSKAQKPIEIVELLKEN
ncbi:PTS sugar transporter subunit IIA [Eubacterium barkeri]|uniref:PTS system IIA component, Fru family n=1 Tax=Eubacterium barkeri TaxID=1528 RepID=A0A1H3JMU0_EUBBA|nr:fructose PTS transporter subunit IIA [Eubacterium barkeri]SDY40698.1 PTS system IIA component, Fru family [Eubacterium barkeri]